MINKILSIFGFSSASPKIIYTVGNNYSAESENLVANAGVVSAEQTVNFSHPLRGRLAEHGISYYRDVLSIQDECTLFKNAYDLVDRTLENMPTANDKKIWPIAKTAWRHTWASKAFQVEATLHFLRHQGRKPLNEHRSFAVLDLPFGYPLELGVLLPNFEFVSPAIPTTPYPYGEVVRHETDVIAARAAIFSSEQEALGDLSPYVATDIQGGQKCVLVAVDDSGTGVNTASLLPILETMVVRGLHPVVLTSQAITAEHLPDIPGVTWKRLPEECPSEAYASFCELLSSVYMALFGGRNRTPAEKLFVAMIGPTLYSQVKYAFSLAYSLNSLRNSYGFDSLLAVNEGNAVTAGSLAWAQGAGVTDFGFTPILLMNHPTCMFFPATRHIIYGEQVREIIKMSRQKFYSESSVFIVGTPHFDRCLGRDRATDRQSIEKMIPIIQGRKLVILATENRPRELDEVLPAIRYLFELTDTFVVVKLHPSDSREYYFSILRKFLGEQSNVKLIQKEIDVLSLVSSSDLLVTMGSNLIVEAAAMGRISLSYNFSGTPCPIDFVKEGLCCGANSILEFEQSVQRLLFDEQGIAEAQSMLSSISRFNGLNDGQSAERITSLLAGAIHHNKN